MAPRLLLDLRPLRASRELRLLYAGRSVSQLGGALTTVAASLQVYDLTRSSLVVGSISVVEVVPMVVGMLVGGALADAVERRRLILVTQSVAGLISAALALNAASPRPQLWLLFLLVAAEGAVLGLGAPAWLAAVPTMVPPELLPAALALNTTLSQASSLLGPAVAGIVIAHFSLTAAYGADAGSFLIYVALAARLRALPAGAGARRPGLSSFVEGLGYVRRHALVGGLLLIDVNAMVFGMPTALFPALGTNTFHGGATAVGLLYAAPSAGAIVAAATSGWIPQVPRSGLVLIGSVMLWGCAIAGFGLVDFLPLALLLLGVAGAADVISEVLRSTLLQLSVPDALRGRLSALWLAQANAAPALGNLEAGAVGTIATPAIAVISGGLACVFGALLLGRLLPGLREARLTDFATAGKGGPAGAVPASGGEVPT